jgi:hypothetical protein
MAEHAYERKIKIVVVLQVMTGGAPAENTSGGGVRRKKIHHGLVRDTTGQWENMRVIQSNITRERR